MACVKIKKCPLCNTDPTLFVHEVKHSQQFLETHPINYSDIFDVFVCVINDKPRKSCKIDTKHNLI